MCPSQVPPVSATRAAPASLQSAIILVVDDEQPILLLLRDLLEDEGYIVRIAHDGADAAVAQDAKPDLVLTDLMMPTMDRRTLARRLRSNPHTAHIPLVAMTAEYHTLDTTLFADVIAKPFEVAPLFASIGALLPSAA